MAKQKNSKPQPQAKPVAPDIIEPPGGTVYLYSNLIQITWTVVDLKIRFAEFTKIDPNGHSTITERAVATMAWAQAKALMKSLEEAVANYEQTNGEIKSVLELKLPPGVVPIPAAS